MTKLSAEDAIATAKKISDPEWRQEYLRTYGRYRVLTIVADIVRKIGDAVASGIEGFAGHKLIELEVEAPSSQQGNGGPPTKTEHLPPHESPEPDTGV
jgi:hypothetical protein